MTINADRLAQASAMKLSKGNHKSIEQGACIMELTAYVANEPWSDRPECACPTLTNYAITLNDRLDDESRQLMTPLIPILVGTRGTREDRIARAKFMVWRMLTVTTPIFLDAIKLPEISAALRLTTQEPESFRAAEKLLRDKRGEIRIAAADAAAAYAAYDAAADAADAAAYAAAADAAAYDAAAADAAAYAAAADAAAYDADAADAAAYAAADAAAYDAADAAAYAAADAAAYDAAAVPSVKQAINESAIETLRLACAVKA